MEVRYRLTQVRNKHSPGSSAVRADGVRLCSDHDADTAAPQHYPAVDGSCCSVECEPALSLSPSLSLLSHVDRWLLSVRCPCQSVWQWFCFSLTVLNVILYFISAESVFPSFNADQEGQLPPLPPPLSPTHPPPLPECIYMHCIPRKSRAFFSHNYFLR